LVHSGICIEIAERWDTARYNQSSCHRNPLQCYHSPYRSSGGRIEGFVDRSFAKLRSCARVRISDSQNLKAFRFDGSPSVGKTFRIEPLDQFKSLMALALIRPGIENIIGLQPFNDFVD
jgi:hypothetical protein